MSTKNQFRVLADYEVNDPHPLILGVDVAVKSLRTDASWPGWLWAEADGNTGWIPLSYIEKLADGDYRTKREYNGTELSARKNDVLSSLESESGWIFAEAESGETGWFPLFNLRPCP